MDRGFSLAIVVVKENVNKREAGVFLSLLTFFKKTRQSSNFSSTMYNIFKLGILVLLER